jgi:hypothetical protein
MIKIRELFSELGTTNTIALGDSDKVKKYAKNVSKTTKHSKTASTFEKENST